MKGMRDFLRPYRVECAEGVSATFGAKLLAELGAEVAAL
jgi:hypothetical protein